MMSSPNWLPRSESAKWLKRNKMTWKVSKFRRRRLKSKILTRMMRPKLKTQSHASENNLTMLPRREWSFWCSQCFSLSQWCRCLPTSHSQIVLISDFACFPTTTNILMTSLRLSKRLSKLNPKTRKPLWSWFLQMEPIGKVKQIRTTFDRTKKNLLRSSKRTLMKLTLLFTICGRPQRCKQFSVSCWLFLFAWCLLLGRWCCRRPPTILWSPQSRQWSAKSRGLQKIP